MFPRLKMRFLYDFFILRLSIRLMYVCLCVCLPQSSHIYSINYLCNPNVKMHMNDVDSGGNCEMLYPVERKWEKPWFAHKMTIEIFGWISATKVFGLLHVVQQHISVERMMTLKLLTFVVVQKFQQHQRHFAKITEMKLNSKHYPNGIMIYYVLSFVRDARFFFLVFSLFVSPGD